MGNSEISLELVLSVSYFNLSAFIVFLNEEIIGNKKRCVCKMCTGISLLKFRSICVSPWITVWWRGMDSHLNVLKIGLQKQSLHHPQEGWWKRFLGLYKVQIQNPNAGQGTFSYKISLADTSLLKTELLLLTWGGASATVVHNIHLLWSTRERWVAHT